MVTNWIRSVFIAKSKLDSENKSLVDENKKLNKKIQELQSEIDNLNKRIETSFNGRSTPLKTFITDTRVLTVLKHNNINSIEELEMRQSEIREARNMGAISVKRMDDALEQYKNYNRDLIPNTFSIEQREEIVYGREDGINVDIYLNPEYTSQQMKQIRMGLVQKVDVSAYANPSVPAEEMEKIRISILTGNTQE